MSIFDREPEHDENYNWQRCSEYLTKEEKKLFYEASDRVPVSCPNCQQPIMGWMFGDEYVYYIEWKCLNCQAEYLY